MTTKTSKIAPTTLNTTARFAVPDTNLALAVDHAGGEYSACIGDDESVTASVTASTLTRATRDLRAHIKGNNIYPFLGNHKATVLVFLENTFTLKAAKSE